MVCGYVCDLNRMFLCCCFHVFLSSIQFNQWKNSSGVLRWLRNIENKPNCSFINSIYKIFTRQFCYHCLTEQLSLERKSKIYQMMKFPSSSNQGERYYSVMVNRRSKKMTMMISVYQWATTMNQRCAS